VSFSGGCGGPFRDPLKSYRNFAHGFRPVGWRQARLMRNGVPVFEICHLPSLLARKDGPNSLR